MLRLNVSMNAKLSVNKIRRKSFSYTVINMAYFSYITSNLVLLKKIKLFILLKKPNNSILEIDRIKCNRRNLRHDDLISFLKECRTLNTQRETNCDYF
ncbi:CLUMA_CG008530, isoform A [Clunio marinus]|uniref:CLUMA_CG008530, isoform A n=1 Tax=Clunio marinus TaxID=568069 RepID=A0A1J1I3X9_9DIPT|nr:CLUMA_CG008530, isoform A [Clunio marinus]